MKCIILYNSYFMECVLHFLINILDCICIVCIGTKAEKSLKFNVRTMVIYPVLAGLTLVGLCFVFHGMSFGSEPRH